MTNAIELRETLSTGETLFIERVGWKFSVWSCAPNHIEPPTTYCDNVSKTGAYAMAERILATDLSDSDLWDL